MWHKGLEKVRAFFRPWTGIFLAFLPCIVVCVASLGELRRLDLLASDLALRWNYRAASEQIVLVSIDQPSLDKLGRWPWPRHLHAKLIDQITQSQAAAIGLDILLSEAEAGQAHNDVLLEQALRRAGNVVLPMSVHIGADGRPMVVEPLAGLALASAATAHVNYEPDSDGIVRSVFLQEGAGSRRWDHFSLAVLRASGLRPHLGPLPGARAPPPAQLSSASMPVWQRDYWLQIVFAGPPGHFKTYAYADVLEGRVPAQALRGKIVLVGAGAAGMGDTLPTPVGQEGAPAMAGVELMANVLDGLLQGQNMELAKPWQNMFFGLLPVLLAMWGLRRMTPRNSLLLVMALIVLTPLAAGAAQTVFDLRLGVTGPVMGLLLAYPLWSWQRQELALAYLSEEFERIRQEQPTLNFSAVPSVSSAAPELEQHIASLKAAADHLRGVQAFLLSSIHGFPDAVLTTGPSGCVIMANPAAARQFHQTDVHAFYGLNIHTLLQTHLPPVASLVPRLDDAKDPQAFMFETAADSGCDLLVKGVPRFGAEGEFLGWIVILVDIASVRAALKSRDEALNFISHDIRGPQASILTLIELQSGKRGTRTPEAVDTLLSRIGGFARQSLSLAENFMHLARAKSGAFRLDESNLSDILVAAVDQMWVQAESAGIRIQTHLPAETAWCALDASLMVRAITNVLDNAIKFSPLGATILCSLQREDDWWCIGVLDQGVGLSPQQIPLIFQKFQRLKPALHMGPDGAGLGLTFVQTVIDQHKGKIHVSSAPGVGTHFQLKLPALGIALEQDP